MRETALDRFRESTPTRPYATNDLETGLHIFGRDQALGMAYVQLHGIVRQYLPFDIDRPGAAFAWEDSGLPPFTITIVNPSNAHAHALYELEAPVLFPDDYGRIKARYKPMAFYRAVREAYRHKLGADGGFVGLISKNPLHERWETIINNQVYTLEELADYVDLSSIRSFETSNTVDPANIGQIPDGTRNDTVFDLARKLTYPRVRESASYEELHSAVMNICTMLNLKCIPPLGEREIFRIARSITRYCWQRREVLARAAKNRGACGFNQLPPVMEAQARILEVRSRQAAGAYHTHQARRNETEGKIRETLAELKVQGVKATKSAVARRAGVSRDTVQQYRHLWEEPKVSDMVYSDISVYADCLPCLFDSDHNHSPWEKGNFGYSRFALAGHKG